MWGKWENFLLLKLAELGSFASNFSVFTSIQGRPLIVMTKESARRDADENEYIKTNDNN